MIDRVDRILEILDVGEQYTTPEHYGFGDIDVSWLVEILVRFLEAMAEAFAQMAEGLRKAFAIEVTVRE